MSHDPMARARALYFDLRRRDLAIEEARRALAANPDSAEAHGVLALGLSARKEFAAAMDAAREAVRCSPQWAWAHSVVGWVWYDQDIYWEAEAAFREAVRLEPTNAYHWEMTAESVRNLGRPLEALELADRGLEQRADHAGCLQARGLAFFNLNRLEEAAAAFEAALARDPTSARAFANLGAVRLRQARPWDARPYLRTALELDPGGAWAQYQYALAVEAPYRWLAFGLVIVVQDVLLATALLTNRFFADGLGRDLGQYAFWILVLALCILATAAAVITPGVSGLLMSLRPKWRADLTPTTARARSVVCGGFAVAVVIAMVPFAVVSDPRTGLILALGLGTGPALAPIVWFADGCAWPWRWKHRGWRFCGLPVVAVLAVALCPFNLVLLSGGLNAHADNVPQLFTSPKDRIIFTTVAALAGPVAIVFWLCGQPAGAVILGGIFIGTQITIMSRLIS